MFKEFDSHPNNLIDALEAENYQAIMAMWQQSPERQEEIASRLYMIEDTNAAMPLVEFLQTRFDQAQEPEKLNIITALTEVGIRNLPAESAATDFLLKQSKQEPSYTEHFIGAIKKIALSSSIKVEQAQFNREPLPPEVSANLDKILVKLLTVIEGNFESKVKKTALRGIWRHKDSPESERLLNDLKNIVQGEEVHLSDVALSELAMMIEPTSEFFRKALKKQIARLDCSSAPRSEILSLVLMVERSQDATLIPFLENLQKEERFPDDYQYHNYINLALQALSKERHHEN